MGYLSPSLNKIHSDITAVFFIEYFRQYHNHEITGAWLTRVEPGTQHVQGAMPPPAVNPASCLIAHRKILGTQYLITPSCIQAIFFTM
jgi:hypothetical protein